ncbi:MAG: hypothetical protein ACRDYF_01575 [Acidimicrobiia bacterium]
MGSQGVQRRKVRRRPPVGDGAEPQGSWELQNSPFTFEGQIEGLGRFGRGLGTASPRMRLMAKVVAATFLLPFVVWIWNWLGD